MMPETKQGDTHYTWLHAVSARGWGDAFGLALDVLEPLGPLGAQLLWVTQPVLGVFVARDVIGDLARSLEEPDGIERLREQLEAADALDEES